MPLNKRLPYLHAIRDVGAERVLLAKDDAHHERAGLATFAVDGKNRLLDGKRQVGRIANVSDAKTQAKAATAPGVIVVDEGPDRIIPLENLIAARQDRPGTLFARTRSARDAALCAVVLERGVHGIVLVPSSPQEVLATDLLLREARASQAPTPAPQPREREPSPASPASAPAPQGSPTLTSGLAAARISKVDDGGVGDRVCVDTTSLLQEGEGLLVGSTARSFALVHAETATNGLIAARPFRVNAGAVHSYLLGPDGTTRYLSELAAGQTVLAVHRNGTSRQVTVGRVKIERRPHLIVHWDTPGGPASVALQNAETVCLVRPDGTTLPVTRVQPGDAILVQAGAPARHAGIAVDENVEER